MSSGQMGTSQMGSSQMGSSQMGSSQMGSMRMNPGSQPNYSSTPKVAPQSQQMSSGGFQQGMPAAQADQGAGNMMAQNTYSESGMPALCGEIVLMFKLEENSLL